MSFDNNIKNAHVIKEGVAGEYAVMGSLNNGVKCHACRAIGHISRFCKKKNMPAWRRTDSTGIGGRGAAPLLDPPHGTRLH
jgi:hypothetical protein